MFSLCLKTRRHQQQQEIEAAILIQHQYRRYKEVSGYVPVVLRESWAQLKAPITQIRVRMERCTFGCVFAYRPTKAIKHANENGAFRKRF